MKRSLIAVFLLVFSISTYAEAKKALFEYLIGSVAHVDELFLKVGIDGTAAQEAKSSLSVSLAALNKGKGHPKTKAELEAIFGTAPELKALLSKDISLISADDLAKIINRAARESERLTGGSALLCSRCVDLKLAKAGVESVALKSTSLVKGVIASMPKDPKSLVRDIKRLSKGLKISSSDLDKLLTLPAEDHRNLWAALKLLSGDHKVGSELLKEFSASFKAFHTLPSGETHYSSSRLWSIVTEAEGEQLSNFSKLFSRLSNEGSTAQERVTSFTRYFENEASKNETLSDELAKLRSQNCWKVF